MAIYQQLKGLFKSELIQMKRNIFLSLIEILCPIALLLFFLFLSLPFKQEEQKYESVFKNDLQFFANYSTNLTNEIKSKEQIFLESLQPNSYIPYYFFLAQCQFTKHVAIIGKEFPQKLKNKISSHFWELDGDIDEDEFFKEFSTIEEFQKYLTSKKYGTNDILYPKICFGISHTDKFKFGIHYKTINIDESNPKNIADLFEVESPCIPEMKSNKNDKIRNQENLNIFKYYKDSGYLMVMKIIYDYILQEITEDPNSEINFSVIEMKYDEILKNDFHKFLYLLGFFVVMSYAIPLSINIYKEIHFRETKKKEYLKSMGVTEINFFICFFVKCFIINIFQSIFCSLLVKVILKQAQYIYLFIIFLFYGLVIFSMTYFFQSFLQESRIGVIISLLIYCIMCFFYLPLYTPAANRGLAYFCSIFFPPTNLLLGFEYFYMFEKEFSPIKNRLNLDLTKVNITLMMVFLFINFIIYLLLGFVISQFFCYEYGVNHNKFYNIFCCFKDRAYYSISNPQKRKNNFNENTQNKKSNINEKNKDIKRTIINNNFNQINNINININFNGTNQLGTEYDDNELNISDKEIEIIDNKNIKNNNNIQEKPNFLKNNVGNTFSKTLPKKLSQNKAKKEKEKEINQKKEKIGESGISNNLNDNCEDDADVQKDIKEIRNKRLNESTLFNFKTENNLINKNQNINGNNKNIRDDISLTNTFCYTLHQEKNENKKEPVKPHVDSRLEINNIIKRYKNEKEYALNGLSFQLYENEIFALLGQNGAGKSTFISILSGLIEANKGNIKYKKNKNDIGLEVLSPQDNLKFRKILGVCHQNNNILYDDLTVEENLEIFCLLKYDKKTHGNDEKSYIRKEIESLIEKFDLKEKRDEFAKNLSGGLKRRLCIAIAFSGRSKVIILDEPTGGIDILSRKKIWEILKNLKNDKRIILLITHFMDETSFLADKIGILKKGKLMDEDGTIREFINKYGKYITIRIDRRKNQKIKDFLKYINDNIILKNPNNFNNENNNDSNNSLNEIESFYNEKMEYEIFKERVEIKIPTKIFDFSKSSYLLKDIENKFNIKDYRILRDQLEDAFINAIKEESNEKNEKNYEVLSKIDKNFKIFNSFENFKNQLKILIFKRGYETKRDKKSFILEIIFPIILALLACIVSYIEAFEENKTIPIELNNFSNDTQTIYYTFANTSDYMKFYSILFNDANEEKKKMKNYNFTHLPNFLGQKYFNTIRNVTCYFNSIYEFNKNMTILNNTASFYFIKAEEDKHKYEFVSYVGTKQRHSIIAFNNYLLNNIIKYEIKQGNKYREYLNDIVITNSPFHLSYNEKNDKKTRNGFILAFYISVALSLIPANFITIIIREKENKSKHLQLLSGISIYIYWINNYIFELIKYYFVVGICLIILVIFKFYEKYLIVFYILYGPASVSFTYVVSYFFDKEGTGQTIILLINLIFGALGSSALLILRINKNMKKIGIALSYIFRFVPSFCISFGYSQLMSQKSLFAVDYYKNNKDYEILKQKYNDSSTIIKDKKYILGDIIYLVIEIFLYTALLIFLENKDYFLWRLGIVKYDPQNYLYNNYNNNINNQGYTSGRAHLSTQIINRKYPLKVIELKKSYKSTFICCKKRQEKIILSNVTFDVQDGECFGLLGSNGEGKTTSFKCLCKEIKPDSGIIRINDIDIFDYSTEKKPNIGYCPQFDSIFEFLTVEENLQYYGRLKGINQNSLRAAIDLILEKLNLKSFQNKLARELSGGNKRKLSVGISLIIMPNVILLDEPSTGMDPYTRRLLLQFLYKAYLKKHKDEDRTSNPHSVVLTTHSIEEAESLCGKLGILVKGSLSVVGTISEILQQNSKGIELNVEFKKPSPDDLKKKYGNILRENISNQDELEDFLKKINKKDYCPYIDINHFRKDIVKIIRQKSINKFTILRWVEYLNNLFKLVKKIKEYYNSVECTKFKINNFILNIDTKDKNDNYLLGIMEKYKEIYFIEEYSYNLTTLEYIFIEQNKNKNNLNRISDENNIKL